MPAKQSSNKIFMVEPREFYSNPQTEGSNHYQMKSVNDEKQLILDKALIEFQMIKQSRLSVVPVTKQEWNAICKMANLKNL